MKKYIYITAMLLSAASCAKENTVSSDLTSGESKITVIAGDDDTKTAISHAEGKYSFTWQAGDAISLVEYVAETQAYQKVTSNGVTTPGNTASFTATLGALSKEDGQNYHYLAAYPYTAIFSILGWQGEGSDTYPIMAFGIPSTQTLPSCSSFDPAADILVSQPIAASERPSSINACFARIGGMLKIHFTGLPTEGEEIYINYGEFSIEDYSGSYNLASNFLYYTGEQSVMGYSSSIADYGSGSGDGSGSGSTGSGDGGTTGGTELVPDNKITIVGGTQCPVNTTDGSADVWLRCCPGTVSYGVLDVFLDVMVDGVSHQCTKNAYITPGGGSGTGSGTGGSTGTGSDGSTSAGGSDGGDGTGGGTTASGLVFRNGEITAITVAVEDQTPKEPDINVSVTKTEVSGNSCILTVKTESKSGATPTLNSTAVCTTVSTYTDPSALYFGGQVKACSDPVETTPGEFVLELKDLDYSTTYYYTIRTYDTSTYEEYYSAIASFTTGSAPKYVSAPNPVNVNVKDNGFEAFWSPVNGAKEYHCSYCDEKSGEGAEVTATYISSDNMWKATGSGLADGNYIFMVSVEPDTDSGWEINPSDPYTAQSYWPFTIGEAKYVAAPSVTVETFDGGFYASWNPVEGAKGYICYYMTKEGGTENWLETSIDEYSGKWYTNAEGLAEGEYILYVGSEPDDGWQVDPKTYSVTQCDFMIESKKEEAPVTLYVAYLGNGKYIASGYVADKSLRGNDNYAYIYWKEGTYTDPSKLQMRAGGAIGSDGSFSCTGDGLTEGNIYSFCAAIDPDRTGSNMQYSEIFYLEAKK